MMFSTWFRKILLSTDFILLYGFFLFFFNVILIKNKKTLILQESSFYLNGLQFSFYARTNIFLN